MAFHLSEETKKKQSLAHFGKNHSIETKKKMSLNHRKYQSLQTKKKISSSMKGRKLSKEHSKKIGLANKGGNSGSFKKGIYQGFGFEKGHKETEETRQKRLKNAFKELKIRPNKPEKIIINLIQQNNLNFIYVGDGKKLINGFCPDFIHKEKKLIIEHFGDYWHNLPQMIKKDKRRFEVYSKKGYKTLIIWENELKNDLFQVINKIRGFTKCH